MIFVTGGTGLLGNCVVRELCARREVVRCLCRKGSSLDCFEGLPIEIVEGDLHDAEILNSAIQGCSAVIHSAALIHIGWANLEASREVNVQGTRHVVEACLKANARLLHISTVDTLPAAVDRSEPIDERALGGVAKTPCSYVISKTEAERVVRQALETTALDAVIIHPGFMLGPFDWKPSSGRMMLEVTKAPVVLAPRGGCSFCDARDVAAGIVNAIERGERGQSYILAGENLTYQELWHSMLEAAGKSKRVGRLGPAVRLLGWCIDLGNRLLPIREGDLNGASIAMGNLNHFYNSSKAENQLSYHRRPSEETLRDAWAWLSKGKLRKG